MWSLDWIMCSDGSSCLLGGSAVLSAEGLVKYKVILLQRHYSGVTVSFTSLNSEITNCTQSWGRLAADGFQDRKWQQRTARRLCSVRGLKLLLVPFSHFVWSFHMTQWKLLHLRRCRTLSASWPEKKTSVTKVLLIYFMMVQFFYLFWDQQIKTLSYWPLSDATLEPIISSSGRKWNLLCWV